MPDNGKSQPGGRNVGKQEGFTLLEMMIVLAIIGLMIGLAVPWIGRGGRGGGLTAAASEIRIALQSARASAVADGQPVTFRGDIGGYWLGGYHYALSAAADPINRLQVATGGGARISFYPSGASSGGRVYVLNATTRREIAVDAVTGRATLLP